MPVVKLPVGGTVDVSVDPTISRIAANPVLQEIAKADPFEWRVKVGNPGGSGSSGVPAMAAKFTLKPRGAPAGMFYGVRQIVFFEGSSSFHLGRTSYEGSILSGSTAINFTWIVDSVLSANGAILAAPALPFFSTREITIANGATGEISLSDTPGGTERLVRANLVTSARNYLDFFSSKNLFITYAVAVLPDATQFVLAGFSWRHDFKAVLTWDNMAKPTLDPQGDVSFVSKLDRDEILARVQSDILERNDLAPTDVIGFKFNNSLMTCLMIDAGMSPLRPSQPKNDIKIIQPNYSITHSLKQQL